MNYANIETLIKIQKNQYPQRGNVRDPNLLDFAYKKLPESEEIQFLETHGISHADSILLESYAGLVYRNVNEQLRERDILDIDEFESQYENHLNEVLDKLKPCNNSLVYRWHLSDDILNFLSNNQGKTVQFPAFISTSLMLKEECSNLHLKTSSKSNGKCVYKYLRDNKAEAEKEVLFKSMTKFEVVISEEESLHLIECENQHAKVDSLLHYYIGCKSRAYSSRALKCIHRINETPKL